MKLRKKNYLKVLIIKFSKNLIRKNYIEKLMMNLSAFINSSMLKI